jgi:hypothetical protein
MFGPEHPRRHGTDGLQVPPAGLDPDLPGFGPFGTSGQHCFDEHSPAFVRIAALATLRQQYPVLRYGRQYPRPISLFEQPFGVPGGGEIVAWSRILDDEEALCVLNSHGTDSRGGDVVVDAGLSSAMTVIANTAEAANPASYTGSHRVGSSLPVLRKADGTAYVEIRNVGPSEGIVLTNRP